MTVRGRQWLLWIGLASLVLACGGSEGDAGGDDAAMVDDAASDTQETGAEDTTLPEDMLDVDVPEEVMPPSCPADCPAGYCDEETWVCEYCESYVDCPSLNHWCHDTRCVETACVPGRTDCDEALALLTCSEDGEVWESSACPEGQACSFGECAPVICTPGEEFCELQKLNSCDESGTWWHKIHCPPGQSCDAEGCAPLRHNVLILFDTSGSMSSIMEIDAIPCICANGCPAEAFPTCEQLDCPRSRLGLAKLVFHGLFTSALDAALNVALLHFPLRVKYPAVKSCNNVYAMGRGYYGNDVNDPSFMTGDTSDEHVVEDGGWFDQHLFEVLSVPFPKTFYEDMIAYALLWVNGDEQVGPSSEPCADQGDCLGGFCAPDLEQSTEQSFCHYHTDPELRAFGGTPLGRSMFYAGEYFRKYIVVEGRECEADADCENMNYHCREGLCHDAYRECRQNLLVVFTDGAEDPPTSVYEFSNPSVLAKRYRYGLGCEAGDASACNAPAYCAQGVCGGYPFPNGSGSMGNYLKFTEDGAAERLFDPAGNPIPLTTHVIDMDQAGGSATANKMIADNGGGKYFKADTSDPDSILYTILYLVDVKEGTANCIP